MGVVVRVKLPTAIWVPGEYWTDHDPNRQTRDPTTRYTQLDNGTYGHITWANSPASRLAELDDIIDMGYAGPSVRIRDVMSTTSGPFCYFYEESP